MIYLIDDFYIEADNRNEAEHKYVDFIEDIPDYGMKAKEISPESMRHYFKPFFERIKEAYPSSRYIKSMLEYEVALVIDSTDDGVVIVTLTPDDTVNGVYTFDVTLDTEDISECRFFALPDNPDNALTMVKHTIDNFCKALRDKVVGIK